jgi:hypothetical protein
MASAAAISDCVAAMGGIEIAFSIAAYSAAVVL